MESISPRSLYRVAWATTCLTVLVGILIVDWRTGGNSRSRFESGVMKVSWWLQEPGEAEPWSAAYSRAALARITLQSMLNHTTSIDDVVAFVPPCMATKGNVVESTSSLLLVTALTKADNTTLRSHSLWHYFNSLFTVPSWGFIPRYSYPIDQDTTNELYVESTRIPNWSLFRNDTSPCRRNETSCWVGSGRISAIPFHGTVLLELLLHLQRRRQDGGTQVVSQNELNQLYFYWNRIFDYHEYIHDVVMRGCNNQTKVPCYNILHPWESLLEASSSPSWHTALNPVMELMLLSNWTPPFQVPTQVQESYDYNETTYNAMLYLNECLQNHISLLEDQQYPYNYKDDPTRHENRLLGACQFAMLDVGYASALAQGDRDLRTVGLWLSAQDGAGTVSSSWATRMTRLDNWHRQNDYVMNLLWHEQEKSFQSRYAIPSVNISESPFPTMRYIPAPSANNLMIFWQDWNARLGSPSSLRNHELQDVVMDEHLQDMAIQLLHHTGQNSFDCDGSYPIWSAGCSSTGPSNHIDPRWNYFVGLGLSRNKDSFAPFGQYLTNATIELICNGDVTEYGKPIDNTCAWNLTRFQEAYRISLNKTTIHLDECGATSMSTASILYQFLVDDFDFTSESPIPPIRNSWVITLITAELMIAFMVGVTCVLLSLHIVRRENREDIDESFLEDAAAYDPLLQDVSDRNQDGNGDDIMGRQ